MSTSDNIINLLELEDVSITKIESAQEANLIYLEVPLHPNRCPSCGTLTLTVHDCRTQKVLDLPLYGKCTYLLYRKRRYRCPDCGKRFAENNSFLPRYAHTTNRFFLRLYQGLHSVVSQKSVADRFTTSTTRIQRVLDSVVPSLPKLPETLGIDEFKGNTNKTKYHCILTDLQTSKPIDILSNRTAGKRQIHRHRHVAYLLYRAASGLPERHHSH